VEQEIAATKYAYQQGTVSTSVQVQDVNIFNGLSQLAVQLQSGVVDEADELYTDVSYLVIGRQYYYGNKEAYTARLRELERLKKRTACSGCSDIYCYAQTEQSLCVDAAGNCWPCSSLTGKAGFLLGNIRNGLPEISCAAASLKPTDTCKKCSSFSYCVGGCPAGRTALGGEPDPMTCVMNRILLEEFKL
jgi:radical SAM protein with 4Fe4S-binding SPASM domain